MGLSFSFLRRSHAADNTPVSEPHPPPPPTPHLEAIDRETIDSNIHKRTCEHNLGGNTSFAQYPQNYPHDIVREHHAAAPSCLKDTKPFDPGGSGSTATGYLALAGPQQSPSTACMRRYRESEENVRTLLTTTSGPVEVS